jgi:hypothetical protein
MKLITQNFKTHAASQFVESFNESSNTIYYATAHKSTPFTDDSAPPSPENTSNYTHYELHDDMLFGKHITPADVTHMVKNIPWTSGTVYAQYDDLQIDLYEQNFYAVSPESGSYHIFKCLSNNLGAASTDQPLFSEIDVEDEIYQTTDNYQWKYMYSVTTAQYSKFATLEFIPFFENTAVTNAAINGSIDTILVTNPGGQYNSYASGTVKESAVAGNTKLYALYGEKFTDFLITVANTTGFIEEKVESQNSDGKTSSGVIVARYANNSFRVTSSIRNFVAGRTVAGITSGTSQTIVSATKIVAELSSNTDFYKNNSFYIRSGTGSGQLRTITEYIVTGEERRVLLNTGLNVLPDATSVFEIGPRVIISGDGQSANAVVTIDPAANSILEIEIINSGTNYTYADIQIIANTGLLDSVTGLAISSTSAQARPIMSPPNGHGSNVINELYSNRVGIGVSFANTESGNISAQNDFRKISILKNPLFANVELTIANTDIASGFAAGEIIVQDTTGASGLISNRDGQLVRLTNVYGYFESGNTTVNVIRGQTSEYAATVDSVDKSLETFDQRQIYQTELLYTGPTGSGFIVDELVIQSGISSIVSDIITLSINNDSLVYTEGEVITQANTGATGVVSARDFNILTITNTTGTFIAGNSSVNFITGGTTSTVSTVNAVDNTFLANAIGYIHSLLVVPANTEIGSDASLVVGLTNVRGFFSVSDDLSGTINTFVGQTSKAEAKITGRSYVSNYVVDNSGEFLYTENFEPVARNVSQTEKVKLIIEF